MSSVNSVRIPGLATGMDTDQMVKDMLIKEQSKVDKAKQKEQIIRWQQESYRDIIKNTKGFYDKYFSAASPDFILGSKAFSTVLVNSSNNNIVSPETLAGANKIDYKFKVEQIAKAPKVESIQIDRDETIGRFITGESSTITINGKNITIDSKDNIKKVAEKINNMFNNREIKAVYSEMTGKLSIEGVKTGSSSKINFSGEFFNNIGMISTTENSINTIKLDSIKTLKQQGIEGSLSINGAEIEIKEGYKVIDLANEITKIQGVDAQFNDYTGNLTIKSNSELRLSGSALEKMGIDTKLSIVESNEIEKGIQLGISTDVIINGVKIEGITPESNIEDLVISINKGESGAKARYDEITKYLRLESKEDLNIQGLDIFITDNPKRQGITGIDVSGSDNKIIVYSSDENPIKEISEQSNIFTVDDIVYNIKGVTKNGELVSMTSAKDANKTVDRVQTFVSDYNKIIDDIYKSLVEKKNKDYLPLTEAQKEDMSDEEIEKWEKKAKEGILKNDRDLRNFIDDIKKIIYEPIGQSGLHLSDVGIKINDDYNKPGQLYLDVDKFKKSLEDNGELVYKATTEVFTAIKDVTYKYAGNSNSIFAKKAGIEKTSTQINNLFSEQIKKQEEQIKKLTRKMREKEEQLYKKFANLESGMNRLNSQMSYLMSAMGM